MEDGNLKDMSKRRRCNHHDMDNPCWPLCNKKRRVLDVYHTESNSILFVEDGVLVEQKLDSPPSHYPSPDHFSPISSSWRMPKQCYQTPPESPECPELGRQQTILTAEAALDHYNKTHDVKYELEAPVTSAGNIWGDGIWFHSSFTAKPLTSSGLADSAVLFFAELTVAGNSHGAPKYLVTSCLPVDDIKTTTQCEICEEDNIVHPTSGFLQGRHRLESPHSRPCSSGEYVTY